MRSGGDRESGARVSEIVEPESVQPLGEHSRDLFPAERIAADGTLEVAAIDEAVPDRTAALHREDWRLRTNAVGGIGEVLSEHLLEERRQRDRPRPVRLRRPKFEDTVHVLERAADVDDAAEEIDVSAL